MERTGLFYIEEQKVLRAAQGHNVSGKAKAKTRSGVIRRQPSLPSQICTDGSCSLLFMEKRKLFLLKASAQAWDLGGLTHCQSAGSQAEFTRCSVERKEEKLQTQVKSFHRGRMFSGCP